MRKTLIALGAALALVAAACGGGEGLAERIIEESIENESGGDVNVDLDTDGDGSISIDVDGDDGGSITIGGGDVPDELVTPVRSGGDVTTSFVSDGDVLVSLVYPASEFDALVEFYEDWKDNQPVDVETFNTTFDDSDGKTIRTVTFSADEINTIINIVDCPNFRDGSDGACVNITEAS